MAFNARANQFEATEATSLKSGDMTSAHLSQDSMNSLNDMKMLNANNQDVGKLSFTGSEKFRSDKELLEMFGMDSDQKSSEKDKQDPEATEQANQAKQLNPHDMDKQVASNDLNKDSGNEGESSIEESDSQNVLARAETSETTNDLNSANDSEPTETISQTVANFEADNVDINDSNSDLTSGDSAISSSAPTAMS